MYQRGFSDLHRLVHMLVGEGLVQNWVKTTNWERSLKLQQGEQPANLLHDQAWAITSPLHRAIPKAFPKPVDWIQNQACTQKVDELVHDYYHN